MNEVAVEERKVISNHFQFLSSFSSRKNRYNTRDEQKLLTLLSTSTVSLSLWAFSKRPSTKQSSTETKKIVREKKNGQKVGNWENFPLFDRNSRWSENFLNGFFFLRRKGSRCFGFWSTNNDYISFKTWYYAMQYWYFVTTVHIIKNSIDQQFLSNFPVFLLLLKVSLLRQI